MAPLAFHLVTVGRIIGRINQEGWRVSNSTVSVTRLRPHTPRHAPDSRSGRQHPRSARFISLRHPIHRHRRIAGVKSNGNDESNINDNRNKHSCVFIGLGHVAETISMSPSQDAKASGTESSLLAQILIPHLLQGLREQKKIKEE